MKKFFLILSLSLVVVLSTMVFTGCFGSTNVAGKVYAYNTFTIEWLSEEDKNLVLHNQTEEEFLNSMEATLTNMYGHILVTFNENGSVTLKNSQTEQTIETTSYVQDNNKVYIYENDEHVTTYHIEKNKFYYEQERDIDNNGEPELILRLYFKLYKK